MRVRKFAQNDSGWKPLVSARTVGELTLYVSALQDGWYLYEVFQHDRTVFYDFRPSEKQAKLEARRHAERLSKL